LCGVGFGLFQSPNLRAIMSSAPAHRTSGASGMVALARLTGQASGAALVALCFNLFGHLGAGRAVALGAVTAGLGALLSIARLRAR
jgi:MFS transporter, DHA2 family, multidrug resistance protein